MQDAFDREYTVLVDHHLMPYGTLAASERATATKPVVERALHALDAGKAVRIAEQESRAYCQSRHGHRPLKRPPTNERSFIMRGAICSTNRSWPLGRKRGLRLNTNSKLPAVCYAQAQARLVANALKEMWNMTAVAFYPIALPSNRDG